MDKEGGMSSHHMGPGFFVVLNQCDNYSKLFSLPTGRVLSTLFTQIPRGDLLNASN
jgi:hypothetical protein